MSGSCCSPRRPQAPAAAGGSVLAHLGGPDGAVGGAEDGGTARHDVEQRHLPGGRLALGGATPGGNLADGERPVHEVQLRPFTVDATTVTNASFAAFVDATGHVTAAERFGFSAVFHIAVRAEEKDVVGPAAGAPWWLGVRGATWRAPGGRRSDLDGLADHPVVHVNWDDAVAYCHWAGRRLLTEAEWEYASRGGLQGARYPWGDEPPEGGKWRANIWQGDFPRSNTSADGWVTTAPVRSYAPNGFGLWQTVGNVWEWCADWFHPAYYSMSPEHDPRGPEEGTARVLRGGSYLCHDSYCNRYRNSARSSNTPDSSMGNGGFRTGAAA